MEANFTLLCTKTKDSITLEDIVTNPIACGYLLHFCKSVYCAENLQFWISVDKYKDNCRALTQTDDKQLRICSAMAAEVWKEFLCENSATEVSLPSQDRTETLGRMAKLAKYRENVFDLALQDPMKTLRKDIRPRFLKSDHFSQLIQRELVWQKGGHPLVTTEPTKTLLDTDFPDNKMDFTLNEILEDKYMFREMLKYLEKRFSAENWTCIREIQSFEESMDANNLNEARDKAWMVFLHFIAPGSDHEVSCSNSVRKSIMLALADPKKEMFADVKSNVLNMLKQDYTDFCNSTEYEDLVGFMKKKRELDKKQRNKSTSRFSFLRKKEKPVTSPTND